MSIAEFQKLIHDRYFATDNARGVPGTFLWLSEEIGELASALADRERGKLDEANLREEFADVLAWLATLANICEVDLAEAIHSKLFTLPDDTLVLPGHGPNTTVGEEKRANPFVGRPAGYQDS